MDEPITRTVRIAAAPQAVWAALVEQTRLAAWFDAAVELDPRPGGAVRFRWPSGIERRGLVTEIDPPYRLSFRWRELLTREAGILVADPTVVTFELEPVKQGTLVTVTETVGLLVEDVTMVESAG